MVLKSKVAVIFAANGEISSAVAHSFAEEGATVFLTGRNQNSLNQLAESIQAKGTDVQTMIVDACNNEEIENCFQKVVEAYGKVDVIFNGIGVRPSQSGYGTPTVMLSYQQFMKPIEVHLGSQFLTSKIGAKYMQQTNSSGTILTLTSSLSRMKVPFMAGLLSACTAIEGLTRGLAAEFGRSGIKVICLNPTALYGTRTIRETTEANAKLMGVTPEQWNAQLSQQYLLGESTTLKQVGDIAAYLASDKGVPMNSHIVDIDCGTVMVI